jgi:hypothetical protein
MLEVEVECHYDGEFGCLWLTKQDVYLNGEHLIKMPLIAIRLNQLGCPVRDIVAIIKSVGKRGDRIHKGKALNNFVSEHWAKKLATDEFAEYLKEVNNDQR